MRPWSIGAVWRRWDPHLHAPGTLLNDQFNGNWDAYLERIETSAPKIEVLGVTDYMCIRAYKEVRRHKAQGRLAGVTLFPNVELRLAIKTEKAQAINLYLLFSPEDPDHEQEIERVLKQLTCDYDGNIYSCCEADFIRIGSLVAPSAKDDAKRLRLGVNQFKVTLDNLKTVRNTNAWFKKHCIVAVAGSNRDGTAGVQSDDSFRLLRKEIEAFADVIFASTPSQRTFWLGRGVVDVATLEREYRGRKPTLHGSDAHREDKVGVPDQDRYTWIKGDATFEALRQAVIEPAERVAIGAAPPTSSPAATKITSVRISNAPWMATETLTLNPGLVAVIGARGSGKTALADILGRGAESPGAGKAEASFLERAKDLLGDAAVELTWSDGTSSYRDLAPVPWDEDESHQPRARYLSQQFVDGLCSATGLATQLRDEIEHVVFDATKAEDRMGAAKFGDLAELWLQPLHRQRSELRDLIVGAASAISTEDDLRGQLKNLKSDRIALDVKLRKAKEDLRRSHSEGQGSARTPAPPNRTRLHPG